MLYCKQIWMKNIVLKIIKTLLIQLKTKGQESSVKVESRCG